MLLTSSLGAVIKHFINVIKAVLALYQKGDYTLSHMMRDRLAMSGFEASKMAVDLSRLTGLYVKVDNEFTLPQVNKLSGLIYLDPGTDKDMIQEKLKELVGACSAAENEIFKVLQKMDTEAAIEEAKRELMPNAPLPPSLAVWAQRPGPAENPPACVAGAQTTYGPASYEI